jgi:hypothetical protein
MHLVSRLRVSVLWVCFIVFVGVRCGSGLSRLLGSTFAVRNDVRTSSLLLMTTEQLTCRVSGTGLRARSWRRRFPLRSGYVVAAHNDLT